MNVALEELRWTAPEALQASAAKVTQLSSNSGREPILHFLPQLTAVPEEEIGELMPITIAEQGAEARGPRGIKRVAGAWICVGPGHPCPFIWSSGPWGVKQPVHPEANQHMMSVKDCDGLRGKKKTSVG